MNELALEAGDLIWTDFEPRDGREQGGRRPAVIVSSSEFNEQTGLLIVCPITSRIRPFPTSVVLPAGGPISGEILLGAIRSIDARTRPIHRIGAAVPSGTLRDIRRKLAAILIEPSHRA